MSPSANGPYRQVLDGLPRVLRPTVADYLDLHRHPELSGAEERTAARHAERLRDAGLEVTTGVGGHGVVGVLRNGPGPVVMLRAELDALPVRRPPVCRTPARPSPSTARAARCP